MAVAKKCDRCGKYYEGLPENTFSYEEDGKDFQVNSFRIGNWNAKARQWESIVSAYDLCKDCGREITEMIFNKGDLKTRIPKAPEKKGKANESDASV